MPVCPLVEYRSEIHLMMAQLGLKRHVSPRNSLHETAGIFSVENYRKYLPTHQLKNLKLSQAC